MLRKQENIYIYSELWALGIRLTAGCSLRIMYEQQQWMEGFIVDYLPFLDLNIFNINLTFLPCKFSQNNIPPFQLIVFLNIECS